MKKIFVCMTLCFVVHSSLNAGIIAIPVQQAEESSKEKSISLLYQQMDAARFVGLTSKKIQVLTGQKLSFTQKISLKIMQQRVKSQLLKGKTVDMNVIAGKEDWRDNFHLGAYLLGLFLGPVGVLIVYLVKYEDPQVARKSAWKGLISWLAIALLVVRLIAGV